VIRHLPHHIDHHALERSDLMGFLIQTGHGSAHGSGDAPHIRLQLDDIVPCTSRCVIGWCIGCAPGVCAALTRACLCLRAHEGSRYGIRAASAAAAASGSTSARCCPRNDCRTSPSTSGPHAASTRHRPRGTAPSRTAGDSAGASSEERQECATVTDRRTPSSRSATSSSSCTPA
jgi:hypothetical protein